MAYTVFQPPRWPRLAVLRDLCGHIQGIGIVWRRQRYVAWRLNRKGN